MENRRKRRQKAKKPDAAMQSSQNSVDVQSQAKPVRRHVALNDLVVPQVMEPRPACAICGEPIESFAEAISEPNGGYSHFDCVIDKIKAQENVQAPDSVSYIGHGTFAVVSKDFEGKYTIKTKIQYESNEAFNEMKKQVEAAKQ